MIWKKCKRCCLTALCVLLYSSGAFYGLVNIHLYIFISIFGVFPISSFHSSLCLYAAFVLWSNLNCLSHLFIFFLPGPKVVFVRAWFQFSFSISFDGEDFLNGNSSRNDCVGELHICIWYMTNLEKIQHNWIELNNCKNFPSRRFTIFKNNITRHSTLHTDIQKWLVTTEIQ